MTAKLWIRDSAGRRLIRADQVVEIGTEEVHMAIAQTREARWRLEVETLSTYGGVDIASEQTHPMPPNTEKQWPVLSQEEKDALVRPHVEGGGITCSGDALGLPYQFDRNNTAGWTSAAGYTRRSRPARRA